MDYNIEFISKLDRKTVSLYEIYKVKGTGVMEDPYYDIPGSTILECTEFEAWIMTAYKNFELHGPMVRRSSWESPHYNYKTKNEN